MSVAERGVELEGTLGALVSQTAALLRSAGIEQPTLEAAWLIEHVLGLAPLVQRIHPERVLSPTDLAAVQSMTARRATREPLQYLLGTQEFLGRDYHVTPAVLIPRPESALLVEETIRRCRAIANPTIVDVGTGSGCLAVSVALALPTAKMIAIDLSPDALNVAQANMIRHGVDARIERVCGDLLAPLTDRPLTGRVDVILSNPPYIAEADWATLQPEVRCFEPRLALVGGVDGLDPHRRLLAQAHRHLTPQGALLMEVGMGQAPALCRLAETTGRWLVSAVLQDEAGIDRVVCCEPVTV